MRTAKSMAALAAVAALAFYAAAQEPSAPQQAAGPQAQPAVQASPEQPKAKSQRELRRELQGQVNQLNGDVAKGSTELPPPPPGAGEAFNFDFMRRSVELNLSDDDKNSLKRLAFEKPDEFRDEMKKRFHAARQKRMEEVRKTNELQKAYRDASSPEDKQKALEAIKALVKEQFDQKMELNKKRLAETEANLKDAQSRLEDFKRKYEERKAKASEIMDERVKDLIKDPDLDW